MRVLCGAAAAVSTSRRYAFADPVYLHRLSLTNPTISRYPKRRFSSAFLSWLWWKNAARREAPIHLASALHALASNACAGLCLLPNTCWRVEQCEERLVQYVV